MDSQWTEALKAVETPSPQIGTYYLNLLLILSVTIPPFVGLRECLYRLVEPQPQL